MNRGLQNDERGFAVVWVLGFCMLVLVLGAVFFQIGNVLVQREKLVAAADAAAAAGATAIDEDELIESGNVVLSDDGSDGAQQRCESSLLAAASPSGNAGSILNQNGATSGCILINGNTEIEATARGTLRFNAALAAFGLEEIELTVESRSRPSCSDNTAVEGGC